MLIVQCCCVFFFIDDMLRKFHCNRSLVFFLSAALKKQRNRQPVWNEQEASNLIFRTSATPSCRIWTSCEYRVVYVTSWSMSRATVFVPTRWSSPPAPPTSGTTCHWARWAPCPYQWSATQPCSNSSFHFATRDACACSSPISSATWRLPASFRCSTLLTVAPRF